MSDVFISYKREDEARVGRLVRALEGTGLSVSSDLGLGGGQKWRRQLEVALGAAKCVVVVWTHKSVGPAGDFVRDEAERAKLRGVLVPVMLDKVDLPLGFGEIQTIDLTHWKRGRRDPFFRDLVVAVTATMEGLPVPAAKGPMKRLKRRATYSGVASVMAFGGLAFGLNLFNAQDRVCGFSLLQPQISDLCGALGIGARSSADERIAWENRELGNCEALRDHIVRFPNGAHREDAANLLAARRVTRVETWPPVTRRLLLVVGQGTDPSADEASARAETLARGRTSAEALCRDFEATVNARFSSAMPAPQIWDCQETVGGVVCGFEGRAVCELEERSIEEHERCGN